VDASSTDGARSTGEFSLARWLPWAVVLLVLAGTAVRAFWPAPPPVPLQVMRSIETIKDVVVFINMSPDGTRIAYAVANGQSSTIGIALRMLDQFEGALVPGTEGGVYPLLSPKGDWVAFSGLADSKLKKIPVTGGTAIPICDASLQGGGAWGDDNTIVFAGAKGLMRVSADGGTPETFTTIDAEKGESAHARPQVLPDGRVLFTVLTKEGPQFAVRDPKQPGHRLVARGGINGRFVASTGRDSHKGHLTYIRGTTLFAVPFDLSQMTVIGSEVPVVEGVSVLGGAGDYAVSERGTLAYFGSPPISGTTMAWADRTGVTKPLPGKSQQAWGTGRLSPDGRLVANGITADSGVRDVWTYDVERGTLTRLTFGTGGDSNDNPIWSPDSQRVYYGGILDGARGIYMVPADGSSRRPTLILATDATAVPTSIAPDGKSLLYQYRQQIQVLPLSNDGQPAKPHPMHEAAAPELGGQFSPDGHWVAYVSLESTTSEVYVLPFPGPGPKVRVSLDGGSAPRWSKDGRELFYWAGAPTARLLAVDVATTPSFRPGQPRELFKQFSTTTWDVSPDRNKFLVELSANSGGSTLAIVTNWFDELRRRVPTK